MKIPQPPNPGNLRTWFSECRADDPGRDGLRVGSQSLFLLSDIYAGMSTASDNVIPFPLHRRREMRGCPQCGRRDDTWQIGRLLWAYCESHELRWVVADYAGVTKATINRRELKKGLEFLSNFAEVSR
ncbi:MAG: hypothetical protein OEM63_09395 [Gammaproteobacteria bacterium]|nr:hypothetical protein [Gammaproteobacteria bacterium]